MQCNGGALHSSEILKEEQDYKVKSDLTSFEKKNFACKQLIRSEVTKASYIEI